MRLRSSPPIPRSPSPTGPAARRHWLEQQIAALTDRLCSEFAPAGGEPAESVRRLVREVHDGVGAPTVLTYLPILIERAVRDRRCATPPPDATPKPRTPSSNAPSTSSQS